MRMNYYLILLIILSIISCAPWKHTMASHGDINEAILNAVTDFVNTNPLRVCLKIFRLNSLV